MMTDSNNENKTATFSGNVYAELQPVKNLKIKSVFGVVYGSSEYRSFKPLYKFSQYIYNEERTTVSQNANHSLGMTWTNTASYDWTMGEHSFNALLGMEAYRYEGTYIEAKNGMLKRRFLMIGSMLLWATERPPIRPTAWVPVAIRIPRAARCPISADWVGTGKKLIWSMLLCVQTVRATLPKATVLVTSLRYRQDGPLLTKNSWKVRKTGSTS